MKEVKTKNQIQYIFCLRFAIEIKKNSDASIWLQFQLLKDQQINHHFALNFVVWKAGYLLIFLRERSGFFYH